MYIKEKYDKNFYTACDKLRYGSAQAVLSLLFEYYTPSSVVDIGCGLGHWLSVCESYGINDYHGVDGHHVSSSHLLIPKEKFIRHDLETPLRLPRRYDLAISIEVGEHLPADKARSFVQNLTKYSDIILFSAAAPYQGGINHFNEQPPKYWASLFKEEGFDCYDLLRDRLWENEQVNCVHAQNILLFANKKNDRFNALNIIATSNPLLRYHPSFVQSRLEDFPSPVKRGKIIKTLLRLFSAFFWDKSMRKKIRQL